MKFRGEYFFLSNMYESLLTYKGTLFNTAEHAYQSSKTIYQEDFDRIKNADTGFDAKRIAQTVSIRNDWDTVKISIMNEILEAKFTNPILRNKLLLITEPIVEENTWNDTFWGVCNGNGKNVLGKLLTQIKNELEFFT